MKCTICGNEKLGIMTEHLRRGKGIVFYCPQCDYGMLKAGFEDPVEYYNKEYRKKFKDNLQEKREESPEEIYQMRCHYQQDRLAIISKYFDTEKSFLEIGCSAGQFLNKIKKNFGYVAGIELSEKCAEYVRNNWDIDVYTEELSRMKSERKFDYIGFFQVLEHIENPNKFLADVYKRLKDEGKVFIEIPTLSDPLRRLWKVPGYENFYYHEAHLSYFSEKSICRLLEKCNYKVEKIYHIQDYNFLNHLYWYFNNEPQTECTFGLNKPEIDFKSEEKQVCQAGKEINTLIEEMNKKYFAILSKYKLTANMFVIASKIQVSK